MWVVGSVVAVCERIGAAEVANFDRREFGVVQTALGPLTLLP